METIPGSERKIEIIKRIVLRYPQETDTSFVYVGCFCDSYESYKMWNEYADELKGACLEVQGTHGTEMLAVRVVYGQRAQKRFIRRAIMELIEGDEQDYDSDVPYLLDSMRFIFKRYKFRNEKEIRIIYNEKDQNSKVHLEIRGDYAVIRNIPLIMVIKGPSFEGDDSKSIMSVCNKANITIKGTEAISNLNGPPTILIDQLWGSR